MGATTVRKPTWICRLKGCKFFFKWGFDRVVWNETDYCTRCGLPPVREVK